MSKIRSVSFKKGESKIYDHAMSKESFSEYVKDLIEGDYIKSKNLFTEEERAEIERIIEEKMKNK